MLKYYLTHKQKINVNQKFCLHKLIPKFCAKIVEFKKKKNFEQFYKYTLEMPTLMRIVDFFFLNLNDKYFHCQRRVNEIMRV